MCIRDSLSPADFAVADRLKSESVISVRGDIRIRGEETYNPKLETGTIELAAREIELLSRAETLPFSLEEGERVRESVRMKYRYLDIRRPQLQKNLRFRHRVVRAVEMCIRDRSCTTARGTSTPTTPTRR